MAANTTDIFDTYEHSLVCHKQQNFRNCLALGGAAIMFLQNWNFWAEKNFVCSIIVKNKYGDQLKSIFWLKKI